MFYCYRLPRYFVLIFYVGWSDFLSLYLCFLICNIVLYKIFFYLCWRDRHPAVCVDHILPKGSNLEPRFFNNSIILQMGCTTLPFRVSNKNNFLSYYDRSAQLELSLVQLSPSLLWRKKCLY
jgi:hypothetical protein